jgi:hypothetical protein
MGSSVLAGLVSWEMVRPERFELPTCCSGGNRSIQLSYGRTVFTVYTGMGNAFNGNGLQCPHAARELSSP